MNVSRARLIPGLVLIALGLIFLFGQYFEFAPPFFILLLGLVFLGGYVATRSNGFLIPGCILSGLGAGLLFARPPFREDAAVSLGLGIGFIAIYVVQRLVSGRAHWWSLIPGGLLLLAGVAETLPEGRLLVERGWPIALILLGLLILASQFRTIDDRRAKP
jgi:hypothetical protein